MECKIVSKRRYKWWKILIIGLITYIIGLVVLVITGNSNIFPSVVILGNFLIPVAYVTFFYEKRHTSTVRMSNTAACFFYGGFVGTFAAAVLEPIFIHAFSLQAAIIVGIIEELTKFLGVLFILKRKKFKLTLDGIILGAAAGMGFAALESTGYAFTSFLRSSGSLSITVSTTLLRGILSPLGHGTWTAILTGIFLRERYKGGFPLNLNVIGGYLLVVLLHGLWDGIPYIIAIVTSSVIGILVGEVIVGLIGVYILAILFRKAHNEAHEELGIL